MWHDYSYSESASLFCERRAFEEQVIEESRMRDAASADLDRLRARIDQELNDRRLELMEVWESYANL